MGTDFFFGEFLTYIEREKKYSVHTQVAYKNDLLQFGTFLAGSFRISQIEEISAPMIRSWIAQLMNDGISSRSVNRKISSLKSLFHFGVQRELLDLNPMKKVVSPKVPKRLPVYVEKSKMEELFDHLDLSGNQFPTVRDRVVLELLYGTGMRLSEAVELKETDIQLDQQSLKVLGKRNKERIIPIHTELAQLLRVYIELKKQAGIHENYLLVTDKGSKAYPRLIYSIVKNNLATVSTLKKKSPHVLRHSYATHLLDNGAELNAIKELLGHANLAATQVYTHNSIERLKDVYKKAHPKS